MATHAQKTKSGIINKYGNIEVTGTGSEGKAFRLSPAVLTVSGGSRKSHKPLGFCPSKKSACPHLLSLTLERSRVAS